MKRLIAVAASALVATSGLAQGGQAGGGAQGQDGVVRSTAVLNGQIGRYLNGPEHAHILTPGDHTDWPLKLEAGQVVIAEASSVAFDPALEIVDGAGKVLASNDDRYPGDQRPLLLWRCPAKGDYSLHGRSFRDKSGGQYAMRFKVFDTIDVSPGHTTEADVKGDLPVLLRISLKRGQVVEAYNSPADGKPTMDFGLAGVVSPCGLPDIDLMRPFRRGADQSVLMAAVDGDYYYFCDYQLDHGRVRIGVDEYTPRVVSDTGRAVTASVGQAKVDIWQFTAKKGEVLKVTTPELRPDSPMVIQPMPKLPPVDPKNQDWSPFYPDVPDPKADSGPQFQSLRGRVRDSRVANLKVSRDTTLWAVTRPLRVDGKPYTFRVGPAALALPQGKAASGKLRAGDADFWSFTGEVGDVVSLATDSQSFVQMATVLDPDMVPLTTDMPRVDQTGTAATLILRRPGENLVQVSAFGDGGTGDYTVTRRLLPPAEFSAQKPAAGDIEGGGVQVWKFTAQPNEPLLLKWVTKDSAPRLRALDSEGREVGLPLKYVSENLAYGLLIVDKPTTYVVVIQAVGTKVRYSLTITPADKTR
ncbi:MAG: hypothetical protein KF857_06350 [Fimbriimonadaceae bacterium]|nr:hypothetical protein [Fimbriimonadaceae bacterium]